MAKTKRITKVNTKTIKEVMESMKELKSFATSTTFVDTVAGTVAPLSQQIVQGDNINQRSGDVIFPRYIQFNLSMLGTPVSGSNSSFHRFIVFQDMLNTGVIPAVGDILDAGVYNGTYSLIYRQQRRFKILYDKMHGVVVGANSNATHVQVRLKPAKRLFYNGTTNATASNGPGSIWFLCMANAVAAATATIDVYANTFYTDA